MSFTCPEDDAFELLAENKLCTKTLFTAYSSGRCVGSMMVIKTSVERKTNFPLYYANNFIFNDLAWKLYIFPNGINEATKGSVFLKVKNYYCSTPSFGYEFVLDYGFENLKGASLGPNLIRGESCDAEFFKEWNSSETRMDICCALRFSESNFRGNVTQVERVKYGDESFTVESFERLYVAVDDWEDVSSYQQDVIFKGEGWKFLVDSSVLSRNSLVFKLMFRPDELELNKLVEIEDVESDVMRDMLHFMYTGRVHFVDYQTTLRLVQAADRYLVHDLKTACEHQLCYNINLTSIADLMISSTKYKLSLLMALCSLMIRIDFDKFALTEHWKRISHDSEAVLYVTRRFVGSFDRIILEQLKEITTQRLYGYDFYEFKPTLVE